MRSRHTWLFILALIILAGCSSNDAAKDPSFEEVKAEEAQSAEQLFEEATEALKGKYYRKATQLYEEVERQYPYSDLATRAQLMSAFSSYQDERYDDAILAIDRFTQLHPGSDKIDYAYYLRALCFYDQISDVQRDQSLTHNALAALDKVVNLFPDSEYSRDAELKRDLTIDHLAGKEMEIGRYYLNRGHTNASINRFREVIKNYQTTTHTAEALFRLTEGYLILGIKAEAFRMAAILGHNYPGNIWYERAYNLLDDEARQNLIDSRGFVDRTVDSIFKPD